MSRLRPGFACMKRVGKDWCGLHKVLMRAGVDIGNPVSCLQFIRVAQQLFAESAKMLLRFTFSLLIYV